MLESMFVEAERKGAYESIVEQIERAIAEGKLKPGDRLPGERQLMEAFGVSRATVREALKVLKATGSISSKPGDPRGPMITKYSPDFLKDSIQRFARVDTLSRAELLQFRISLESTACRLAARLRDDDDLARIEAAHREMTAAAESGEGFPEATNRFDDALKIASHNQMIRVCGNAVADVMRGLVYARLAKDPDRKTRMVRQAASAGRLVDAIRERDADQAAAIVRRNIYRFYYEDLTPEEDEQTRVLVFFKEDDLDWWDDEFFQRDPSTHE